MNTKQIGRNDLCPCGTGKKYKRCCASKDAAARSAELASQNAARAAILAAEAEESADPMAEPKEAPRPKRPKLPTSHGTTRKPPVT